MQLLVVVGVLFLVPQTRWNIPEADVRALGLIEDHFEAFPISDVLRKIFSILEYLVDVLLKTDGTFRLPHEPKFQYVHSSTALYVLISSIVLGVVKFVLLE